MAFYLVTRLRFNNKNLVDPFTLEQWFIAYIDLLQQYRLYHEAMDVSTEEDILHHHAFFYILQKLCGKMFGFS